MTISEERREDSVVQLSLVAHTAFCPRRAWLEVMGEKVDSFQIQEGLSAHKRTDSGISEPTKKRSVDVSHPELGLVGKCDVVEVDGERLVPVEFKATPVRLNPIVMPATRAQLALQKLCLQRAGYEVDGARVYFTSHRKMVDVELSAADEEAALDLVRETRRVVTADTAPEPLEDSPKCNRCSHVGVCLPDERKLKATSRRIVVSDPDSQVVHLSTPGSRASSQRGRLVVRKQDEELASIPLERVQGLVVFGNIDISSALQRELLWRDLTIVFCSGTGRVYGWTRPARSANGLARVAQHVASSQGRLDIAREFVAAKIANQATLLRRNGHSPDVVEQLRKSQKAVRTALSLGAIYGIEGDAAAQYFGAFPTMLTEDVATTIGVSWPGRIGRSASDPLNAALNFAYSMLTSEAIRALVSCGLDPHAGFLHSSNRNKPALALDLMEEFRAPVADSAVLRALNNGELVESDFDATLGTSRLSVKGRKAVIRSVESRFQGEFTHPIFGYKVTWRRAMEIQARQILGVLDGSQPAYRGITLR